MAGPTACGTHRLIRFFRVRSRSKTSLTFSIIGEDEASLVLGRSYADAQAESVYVSLPKRAAQLKVAGWTGGRKQTDGQTAEEGRECVCGGGVGSPGTVNEREGALGMYHYTLIYHYTRVAQTGQTFSVIGARHCNGHDDTLYLAGIRALQLWSFSSPVAHDQLHSLASYTGLPNSRQRRTRRWWHWRLSSLGTRTHPG